MVVQSPDNALLCPVFDEDHYQSDRPVRVLEVYVHKTSWSSVAPLTRRVPVLGKTTITVGHATAASAAASYLLNPGKTNVLLVLPPTAPLEGPNCNCTKENSYY